ncbi:MAG: YheU family protein [Oceanospirillaceae bacterium]|nr:YheU family protein [Oceanospirillaceae bacterium]
MIIPHDQLSPDALEGLIEEYVTRDGTDYGAEEISLAERIVQVKRLLVNGEAVILFSEGKGACNIVSSSLLE